MKRLRKERHNYRVLGPKLYWMCLLHGFTSVFSPWPWPSMESVKAEAEARRQVLKLRLELAWLGGEIT